MARPTGFQVANGLAFVAFAASAAVQVNDPDPLRWIAIYAGAAAACLIPARHPIARTVPAAIGVIALVWALVLSPEVVGKTELPDLVAPMQDKTPEIEYGREMLGLLIAAAWMAVLTRRAYRGASRPSRRT